MDRKYSNGKKFKLFSVVAKYRAEAFMTGQIKSHQLWIFVQRDLHQLTLCGDDRFLQNTGELFEFLNEDLSCQHSQSRSSVPKQQQISAHWSCICYLFLKHAVWLRSLCGHILIAKFLCN